LLRPCGPRNEQGGKMITPAAVRGSGDIAGREGGLMTPPDESREHLISRAWQPQFEGLRPAQFRFAGMP
jgi:hypothetical protein